MYQSLYKTPLGHCTHDPARSYDAGCHGWACDLTSEHFEGVNQATFQLAWMREDRSFEEYVKSRK